MEFEDQSITFEKLDQIQDPNAVELLKNRLEVFEKQLTTQSVQEYLKKNVGEERAKQISVSFET